MPVGKARPGFDEDMDVQAVAAGGLGSPDGAELAGYRPHDTGAQPNSQRGIGSRPPGVHGWNSEVDIYTVQITTLKFGRA